MAVAQGALERRAVGRADQRGQLGALGGVEPVVAALAVAAMFALEAFVDELVDLLGQALADRRRALIGDRAGSDLGVELGAHFGDQRVDYGLRLDVVGLSDLGERLVVVQGGLEGVAVGRADQRGHFGALGVVVAVVVAVVAAGAVIAAAGLRGDDAHRGDGDSDGGDGGPEPARLAGQTA